MQHIKTAFVLHYYIYHFVLSQHTLYDVDIDSAYTTSGSILRPSLAFPMLLYLMSGECNRQADLSTQKRAAIH